MKQFLPATDGFDLTARNASLPSLHAKDTPPPSCRPMLAITLENLVKKFGDITALNGISLRIEPGELFFLLGPSGCGKTTLLRSVAGFFLPDAGQIFFGEEEVTRVPPHQRNTGMMFQSYALWPHMTVGKNVAFGLEERRVAGSEIRRRVYEALKSVQMESFAERKITELSGGQQQRVALARALVIRPRCLLLDEPLSNLDARLRLEMRVEIRRICKGNGLTAIYVTHDQKEALSICDRMAILVDGSIAQVGTPEDVYRRPCTQNVADFIGETNFLKGKIRSAVGALAAVETEHGIFEGRLGDSDWQPIPGTDAVVSVRPESWILSREAPSTNAIKGVLGESIYLGEVAQYRFIARGQDLKILELNPHLSARQLGKELFAIADADDVVILKS
jgi:iron(III) transport system ATP-binding protein